MTGTDPRASNPGGNGPEGLAGDMGVSSGRTGPFEPGRPASTGGAVDEGIQGTGSHGSAATDTEGLMSTERQHPQEPAEGRDDAGTAGADSSSNQEETSPSSDEEGDDADVTSVHGPEMDDTQQRATQDWADSQPAAKDEVDMTGTAEENTAQVPSQPFDRTRNPGHSHG